MSAALLDPDRIICWDALSAIKTRNWRDFDDLLGRLSRNDKLHPELRVASLECLSAIRKQVDDTDFEFLTNHLSESTPSLLRLAAARTLTSGTLKPEQLAHIFELSQQFDTMTLRMFLPIFSQLPDEKAGAGLIDVLERSPAAEVLTTTEIDALTKTFLQAFIRVQKHSEKKSRTAHATKLRTSLSSQLICNRFKAMRMRARKFSSRQETIALLAIELLDAGERLDLI